ncbi:hypothetical protein CPB85DRAFT_679351 [Mucidula mucida]|nr:hypothetical protein CPB85DRAFT_679351 [Mucidula mucida]
MNHYEFPLPQEIVELVVSYISHDVASLRCILQVCRAFAPVARRYLYREITLLDDKNDPERAGIPAHTPPVFSEASFIKLLPSVGHLVKAVKICGSTRYTKQKTYVTSKRLHLILPRLSSLQSISFQRTRLGPWCRHGCVRRRYKSYMLMTAQIAKAIPGGVHTVWLSEVKFESEAAVDVFFSTCRRLTHLGLDKVSVLPKGGYRSGRIAKRVWSVFFPSAPSIPLNMEPIELRSYAHGSCIDLPRLPYTAGESTPYFKLSSVTSLKLYSWDTVPTYWETLVRDTASSVQDLMIATALCMYTSL